MAGVDERTWQITLYSNPQLLSLLGQGWTYASLLRVNTLSSRRIQMVVRPADTVLSVKRRLEDSTGTPIEQQELRRVNMDGATESTLTDAATMQESGVVAGTTLFWVTSADGDIGLFATNNADGCKMASSTGSETVTVSAEEGAGAGQQEGGAACNWWERSGSASGVLAGGGSSSSSPRRRQQRATTVVGGSGQCGHGGDSSPAASAAGESRRLPHQASTASAAAAAAAAPTGEMERRKAALSAAESRAAAEAVAAATEGVAPARPPPLAQWLPNGRRVQIAGLQNPKALHLNGTTGACETHAAPTPPSPPLLLYTPSSFQRPPLAVSLLGHWLPVITHLMLNALSDLMGCLCRLSGTMHHNCMLRAVHSHCARQARGSGSLRAESGRWGWPGQDQAWERQADPHATALGGGGGRGGEYDWSRHTWASAMGAPSRFSAVFPARRRRRQRTRGGVGGGSTKAGGPPWIRR
jgi:hypothetical protein